ncbi:NUDIX hydrolase [Streptomyces sp. NBC_01216]|uniref:NUDIX hydrolase n=1 Tax=Streptomyces sp. NBC_01216 TaxID=2903778 RepID=UPI002E0DA092|nr:NUDIX hydrolase [Streptomyces sp. NBC_01216]
MTAATPVQAAGCALWRRVAGGRAPGIEIALVHRPKYDDWSLPKGKQKHGETLRACAVREVREETGQECVLGTRLPTARYLASGRPKEVAYWAAEAVGGVFVPDDEVDRLLWLAPAEARGRLTQPRDRELLDALLDTLSTP